MSAQGSAVQPASRGGAAGGTSVTGDNDPDLVGGAIPFPRPRRALWIVRVLTAVAGLQLLVALVTRDRSQDYLVALSLAAVMAALLAIVLIGRARARRADAGLMAASPQELSDHVKALAPFNKIGAIKAYREETGAGLADAKRAVDAFLARP